ncbi:MAG: peptidylprolyl isomerase [Polaribacter sp.]|uniref:peptidylprolyl isomerase n=1 Tax=Polaribacter sp. TaxID=1920175 RepID=UPI002F355EAB
MKKSILLIIVLCLSVTVFSQKKEKTIVTINGKTTTVSEFKRVYEKNLDAIDDVEAKDVTKNLELFINYKLKVKQAYDIKLDTMVSYKREMATYRNQLSAPYLKDTTFLDQLVKDAYFRTINEVKAKHILIRMPRGAVPKDTLLAYNKILEIRNRILKEGDFEAVAVEVSEDKSAKGDLKSGRKGNKGNLGYFNAFRMVYPFETAAYNTKVGEISMPFKSQFGYHILKVDDIRASKGEIEAAHILILDTTSVGKTKIDEVYSKLEKKESFKTLAKEYSGDPGSKNKGGNLGVFGSGRMVKSFDDVVFGLTEENTYSKPFKTRFGWHIVKLLKKHSVKSFEEMKSKLTQKVKKSSRMQLSEKAVIKKLTADYTITEHEEAKKILNIKNLRAIPKDSLQNTILSINNKNITQEVFIKFIRNRRHLPVFVLFETFKENEILSYYKENLIYTEPEYAHTLKEYEDGLLLFELMQQKIWNKSSNDSIGLREYFTKNSKKYTSKKLNTIKGEVMNDYQNFLEKEWIADLRRKSKIKIEKRQLKKLIKHYQTK